MLVITSKENQKIKEYKKLCLDKKHRLESGLFPIEGARLICDCANFSQEIELLLITEEAEAKLADSLEIPMKKAKEILIIAPSIAEHISETKSPQGVFALCKGTLFQEGLPENADNGILLLCSLQDPGNVGTILRCAEAFGLSGVVMSSDCPPPTSPKVQRASMGAALRVPIFKTENMELAIKEMQQKGIIVYGASLEKNSVSIENVSLKNCAVAIGNEGAGLSPEIVSVCDKAVILPISPNSESLNAAMAASIFAWELSKIARGGSRLEP